MNWEFEIDTHTHTHTHTPMYKIGFPGGSSGKGPACHCRRCPPLQGSEDPLEKSMATHSSIHAWSIPWTEEPGRLWFTGSQRVRQN